jgi:DNA-binding GntR family transcriptional regulator
MGMPAARSAVADKLRQLSASLGRKTSISDQIAAVLRNLIVSGDLAPGERIIESRVARQLGVGQPTVREALVALEHEGLVVRRSNQGCVVTTLSRGEIAHILRIRRELEVLAVELAVENATRDEVVKLLQVTNAMKAAARKRDIENFFAHDFRFHQELWKLSGNSFLPKLLSQALLPLLAFLFIRNLRNNAPIDLVASAQAHEEIVEAILTRDKLVARAVALAKLEMFANQHESLIGEDAPAN